MCLCGRSVFHLGLGRVDEAGTPGEEYCVQGHDDAEWGHYEHKDVACLAEPTVAQVVAWPEVCVQADGACDDGRREPAVPGVRNEALPFPTCDKGSYITETALQENRVATGTCRFLFPVCSTILFGHNIFGITAI
jgi:hypothetical protein